MQFFRPFIGIILTIATLTAPARAQQSEPDVIGVLSGGIGGTYARFAHQMSLVLDDDQLRILPILGKGSQQNIRDLLYLNGIDIAIVQSDVLDYYRTSKSLQNIESSISYIAKLYNEEIHVVVPEGVRSVKELEGALVSVGGAGSGTEMTAINLFNALGVTIDPVNASNAEALDQVKSGALDAAVFVVGKPGSVIQSIGPDDGLTLLPLDLPKSVQAAFFESSFSFDDYPALVRPEQEIRTISVGAILAVFNWREGSARYKALENFSHKLAEALPVLQGSDIYHPKWREVDYSVEVPGWRRFGGAMAVANK